MMEFALVVSLAVLNMASIVTGVNNCPSSKCECTTTEIRCSEFETFDELHFSTEPEEVTVLELRPAKNLLVDSKLQLNGLRVTKQVALHNIIGFLVTDNPFSHICNDTSAEAKTSNVELALFNSHFEFYETRNDRLEARCTRNDFLTTHLFDNLVLTKFAKLSFNGNNVFTKGLCPFVFKNANIELILAYFMTEANKLDFKTLYESVDIGANVNSFYLFNSNLIYLNERLLATSVFGNLKTFHFEGTIEQIESNLFSNLKGIYI